MGWNKAAIPKVPSMLLGSYSISPYDVTKLYQVIANQGQKIPLTTISSIVDRQGTLIYQHSAAAEPVVPREAAFQTLYAMQRAVERGTGRSLMNDFSELRLAGKTGTTNNARDTWFVGIDGQNVTTVWLGRDDNGETKLTGASGALEIYKNYLYQADVTPLKPQAPEGIRWIGINQYGGWECDHPVQTIPVWADKNKSFCGAPVIEAESESTESDANQPEAVPVNESLWDVLDKPIN